MLHEALSVAFRERGKHRKRAAISIRWHPPPYMLGYNTRCRALSRTLK